MLILACNAKRGPLLLCETGLPVLNKEAKERLVPSSGLEVNNSFHFTDRWRKC